MNIKLTMLSAGILVAMSSAANALEVPTPPKNPAMYDGGPQVALLNTTNLSVAEKSAFALLEGVMQIAEAKIHATKCDAATFDVEIYADGGDNPAYNYISITGANGSMAPQFVLEATPGPVVPGRGQHVEVNMVGAGKLGSTNINSFSASYAYNNQKNMMVDDSVNIQLVGINGGLFPDNYQGRVIKDFYHGAERATDAQGNYNAEFYNIYDWGLQAMSKQTFPVDKWWQRSKTHRSDGVVGRTVWVKDRLVGASECRITIDTNGYNNQSYFWQGGAIGGGTMTIQKVMPTYPVNADENDVEAWEQAPFN